MCLAPWQAQCLQRANNEKPSMELIIKAFEMYTPFQSDPSIHAFLPSSALLLDPSLTTYVLTVFNYL